MGEVEPANHACLENSDLHCSGISCNRITVGFYQYLRRWLVGLPVDGDESCEEKSPESFFPRIRFPP